MARHARSLLRWRSALIACLGAIALVQSPRARGQLAEDGLPPIEPSVARVSETRPSDEAAASDLVSPGRDARLTVVEGQLQKLIDADEKRSADASQQPTFEMCGQVQVDYLWIGQNAANRATVGDAQDIFDFRRARLTARGEAFDVVEYAIGFDFALAGRPSFLDNYIAVRELPLLGKLRVGHFFEPFSLERFTNNRFITFMERPLADTFAPARNLGIMAMNTVGDDDRGTWAVGWFRSNSNDFGENFSDNGGWAVTSRVTWLPYYDDASGGRSFIHLGIASTYRSHEERRVVFASRPEARPGAINSMDIPAFVDTGIIPALSDQRLGAELALVRGPLYIQGEYIGSWVDQIGGPPLFFQGAYGYVSYFLTGENRTYNKQLGTADRVYPFENFFRVRTDHGVETGRGAWEVAVRWSFIDLDSHNVQGGTLNDITLGLNWYLNPYTRVRWEYIHAHLNRAPVGESFAQIVGMRFDIDF